MKDRNSVGTNTVATCVRSCVATAALCFGALNAGADVNIAENTQLDKDTDWTGQGVVTIDDGVTLDLNGYKLLVDGLAGTGTIKDLPPEIILNGDFEAADLKGNAWGYLQSGAACQNWGGDVADRAGYTKAVNSPWTLSVKGTISALVQKYGNLCQTVRISEVGDYVLTYSYRSRNESTVSYAPHELNVEVDGQVCGKTFSTADWSVNTVVLHLTAGDHVIKFAGIEGPTDTTTILDDVSLRKATGELHVVVPESQTTELSAVKFEGAFGLVIEGAGTCLLKADCDWTGLDAVIDTTLDLRGHNLSVRELKGEGTVTDSIPLGEEVIVNGDFEAADLKGSAWGYVGTATCPDWTGSFGGFTQANTDWTTDVKGNVSAFVQMYGWLSESVNVSEEGDYVLTYSYKSRKNQGAHEMNVEVDGQVCCKTFSAADWADNTVVFHLTAGNHTVKFAGVSTTDATSVLDNVSLRKILAGELHVVASESQAAELSAVKFEGAFRVVIEGAGTCLLAADCDWTGINVMIDTTLDLCGHNLFVSELKGAGTVTDSTQGENVVLNGDFEAAKITDNGGTYGYVGSNNTCPNWTGSFGGFTKANTPWTSDVKGTVSAFVQMTGNLSESVTVSEEGDYLLTYWYKSRKNQGAHEMNVEVDGQVCCKTSSAANWAVNTIILHLTAGDHTIKFAGVTTTDATTVLDDVSLRKIPAAGELHVVVPEYQTVEVATVKLDGALKLVKEGAGTYLVSYKNGGVKNCYFGGTSVKEGCFKVHQPANDNDQPNYNFGNVWQLGLPGSETTVEAGASFDCGGNYDGGQIYTIVLNGGTYGNMGSYEPHNNWGTPLCLRLTADSFVYGVSSTQIGETDLAGYTLDVTIAAGRSFYPCGAIRNGTLISRGGRFWPLDIDCSTVDLVLDGEMSCASGTIPFHDLKVTSAAAGFGHGDNFYTVSGTYTPVTDLIHRFKLLNGSTIDLSGRTTTLELPDTNGLFFDENATVYVSLGERKAKASEPLIKWNAKPENVTFCKTPGTVGTLTVKDNGLYWHVGFSIIIR